MEQIQVCLTLKVTKFSQNIAVVAADVVAAVALVVQILFGPKMFQKYKLLVSKSSSKHFCAKKLIIKCL